METTGKLSIILECILSQIYRFQQNPLNYFYEEDIRSELLYHLKSNFPKPIKLRGNEWTQQYLNEGLENLTNVTSVHGEYPTEIDDSNKRGFQGSRFDIALLSENVSENHYRSAVDIGVEIKLRINNFKTSQLIDDITKLRLIRQRKIATPNFTGICLMFDQTVLGNQRRTIDTDLLNYNKRNYTDFQITEISDIFLRENSIHGIHIYPQSDKCIFSSIN